MKKKSIVLAATALMMAAALVIGGTLAYFTDQTEAKVNEFTVGNVNIDLSEPEWVVEDGHTLMPGISFDKDPTITLQAEDKENKIPASEDAYVFLKIDMNKYVSLVNLMGVDAYLNNVGDLQGTYPGFIKFVEKLASDNDLRAAVLDRWFTGINHSDWKVMNIDDLLGWVTGAADQTNPTKLEVILGYIGSDDDTLSAGESVTFMTAFGMPATITQSMMDGEDAYYINGASKSNFNTDASTFKMTFTAYAIQAAGIEDIDAAYAALFA